MAGADAQDTRVVAERGCPGCHSGARRMMGVIGAHAILRCEGCRTVYAPAVLDLSAEAAYDGYYYAANLDVPAFVHRQLDDLVSRFAGYRRLNTWLDVGAGAGALMEAARAQGWRVIGTEVAAEAVRFGRARHLDIRQGELETLDLPESGFDVVTAVEVLEHLADPDSLMAAAAKLLRPGGALYATTPNGRGLSARVLGTQWSVVAPPEHLQLFSPPGLRAAIERAGLSVQTLRTEGMSPHELVARIRRHPVDPNARVAASYRLNESLVRNRAGAAVKRLANAVLDASRLGDTVKLTAIRPVSG